jgi:hypothetical protein
MDINKLIADKEATLVILKNDVAVIERQLSNLRLSLAAASEPTEFEKMLKQRTPNADTGRDLFISPSPSYIPPHTPKTNDGDVARDSERIRNPKGSVEKIALSVLTEQNQTLDEIEAAINKKALRPVSRAAVRTLMMYFKRDGKAVSSAPGVFCLAKKGEAPANSRSAEASSATESTGS